MAENKKSFILYTDYINSFKELTDEEAGKLIKILFSYVNDEDPVIEDRLLRLIFEPIKQQLKRDLKEWEIIKTKKSDSGRLGNLKRWNSDLYIKVVNYKLTLEQAENEVVNRKTSQCDKSVASVANIAVTVNDTVTDNVTVNVIKKREEDFIFWENEKKSFLGSGGWIFKFCRDKDLKLENFDSAAAEFLNDIELKEDFKGVKELKNHFVSWYNKTKRDNLKYNGNKSTTSLPGKTIVRDQL